MVTFLGKPIDRCDECCSTIDRSRWHNE